MLVSDSGETLLVPGREPFTTEVIRPAPGLEVEIAGCGDPDPMQSPTPLTKNKVEVKAADDGTVIDVVRKVEGFE